jgi:hypothetical protein
MTPAVALALPHAPWAEGRPESFARLRHMLNAGSEVDIGKVRVFDERESNRLWPTRMWKWAVSTGATHLVQLQDDVIVAPNFWPALRAMLTAVPDQIIGLHANHPLTAVQHYAGRRWYRDHWLTGPAYAWPLSPDLSCGLPAFVEDWCPKHPDRVEKTNEDSLVSEWSYESKIDIWHPVIAITDVDLGVPSTYGNDGHHEWSMYRQPRVTWRDLQSVAALEDPDWWRCTEDAAPKLPGPGTQFCWYCGKEEGKLTSATTGARLGKQCLANMLGHMVGRL